MNRLAYSKGDFTMGVGAQEGLLHAYNGWCSGETIQVMYFVIIKAIYIIANKDKNDSRARHCRDSYD